MQLLDVIVPQLAARIAEEERKAKAAARLRLQLSTIIPDSEGGFGRCGLNAHRGPFRVWLRACHERPRNDSWRCCLHHHVLKGRHAQGTALFHRDICVCACCGILLVRILSELGALQWWSIVDLALKGTVWSVRPRRARKEVNYTFEGYDSMIRHAIRSERPKDKAENGRSRRGLSPPR